MPSAGKYFGDLLRGDGQRFQGGGSVSLLLPGFEKAVSMVI